MPRFQAVKPDSEFSTFASEQSFCLVFSSSSFFFFPWGKYHLCTVYLELSTNIIFLPDSKAAHSA